MGCTAIQIPIISHGVRFPELLLMPSINKIKWIETQLSKRNYYAFC